jgi:small GTP-binding protein
MAEGKKDYDYMFKLILIGSAAVGKSQILMKYTKDQFSEQSQTTIGVEYATKILTTANGSRIKFQIWDTAGQEKYRYARPHAAHS